MTGLCQLGVERSEPLGHTGTALLTLLVVVGWTGAAGIISERHLFARPSTPTAPTATAVHVLYGDLPDEPWLAPHHQGGGVLLDDAAHPRRQRTGAPAALSVQGLSSRQSLELPSVPRPLAVAGAGASNGVAELTADAAVGHPPGVGALGGVAGGAVVAAAGEVAVLAGLPGHGPAVSPARMVHHEPQRHAVAVLDAVRPEHRV